MTMPPLFNDRHFYRNLFTLAIPIMLQNLISALVNMLNTVMIGRLGTVEIAAVSLGNQIFFLFQLTLVGICTGGAIFTAQFWGKGDIAGIRKNLGFCITLNLMIAALFTLLAALIPHKLIGIYSPDEAVIKAGAAYLRTLSLSFIPFSLSYAFTVTLCSVEKVRLPLAVTFITLTLNGLLNFLFIFGAGPVPAMGVRGAAAATAISRFTETIILVTVSYMKRYVPAGRLKELFSFNRYYAGRFFRITLPVILNEVTWSLGVTIQNVIFARTGTNAIAAFSITDQASKITWVLFTGLSGSAAVLIGKKIGEKNEKTARDYASKMTLFAPMLSVGSGLILIFLSRLLPFAFNVTPETLHIASRMFIILGCSYPFLVFNNMMVIGICRAGGDTVFCMFYEIVTLWFVSLPLAALAAFVFKAPVLIVYLCITGEAPIKAILGFYRLKSGKWLHNVVDKMPAN